jgi:hypothetical protein
MDAFEIWIAALLTDILGAFFKAELPLLPGQIAQATTPTMTDAPVDADLLSLLQKEQADAIAAGKLPPS